MARLAGIADEPEKAPVCLGCHATAAETEPWERDPAFRLEDGVQCEKCHGPGSEYMAEKVMRDPEAARRAGLRRFDEARLRRVPLRQGLARRRAPEAAARRRGRVEAAGAPGPEGRRRPGPNPAAELKPASAPGPKYVGAHALRLVPPGPAERLPAEPVADGPARAGLRGARDARRPAEIAKKMGVSDEPQLAAACLKCHVTGGGPGAAVAKSYDLMEGVGCESCHGAGSEYLPRGA